MGNQVQQNTTSNNVNSSYNVKRQPTKSTTTSSIDERVRNIAFDVKKGNSNNLISQGINQGISSTTGGGGGISLNSTKQRRQYIGKVTTTDLITAFKSNCIDNFYLERERFNLAVKKLFYNLNLPTIAFTHLNDKLYDMVDESGDGRIQIEEFVGGMSKVLGDDEFSKRCK